jgi:hypothetical protein
VGHFIIVTTIKAVACTCDSTISAGEMLIDASSEASETLHPVWAALTSEGSAWSFTYLCLHTYLIKQKRHVIKEKYRQQSHCTSVKRSRVIYFERLVGVRPRMLLPS